MNLSTVNEADGFALAMLVMLVLALGAVLMILLRIAQNASKHHDNELDGLNDRTGVPEPKNADPRNPGNPPREPWEKDADWWKT
ncbi:MAG: hypothetical protein ACQKBU_05800 [Verrucomicrobiales bacterium]